MTQHPIGTRPLYAVVAMAEADGGAVAATGMDWLTRRHGDAPGVHVDADHERGRFVVRGEWWYQGEYTFTPTPDGTEIRYRCDNIARTARWMVDGILLQYRLSGRLADIRDGGIAALLAHLREVHGCATRVVATGRDAGASRD